MRTLLCAAAVAALLSSQAMAAFDLQITEMFGGIESPPSGDNVTDDWFEVTNFGTTAWTSADGDLYFDDDSADAGAADLMAGITSIAPGESVVFVDESPTVGGPNIALWLSIWSTPLTNDGVGIPQVGTYAGSGMSNDSPDGATLFLDTAFDGADPGDIIDAETYPNPMRPDRLGRTYDSFQGGFSSLQVTNAGPNADGFDLIGSPGYLTPEPSTFVLFGFGLAVAGLRRRK